MCIASRPFAPAANVQGAIPRASHTALLALFTPCLRTRSAPASWKTGLIYLIPKTSAGFTGHATNSRPITLLETASKVLIKILLERAAESPLLRNLFYVVCEINRLTVETGDADHDEDAHGFGITLEAGSGLRHVGPNREFAAPPFTFRASHRQFDTLRVAAVAYMDDAAFCASDRDHLQRIVDVVDDFNGLMRINANPAKGAVLRMLSKWDGGALTGGPNDPQNAPLVVRGVAVPWVGKSLRYLGVFIDHAMLGREAANTCLAEARKGLALLKDRRITGKAAVYLLSAVFFPAAAYRSLFRVPSLAQLDRIDQSARALYKLPDTFPTAMLHDRDIIGLHSPADLITQQHVTDLCVMLNDLRPHGLGILQFQTQYAFSPLEWPDLALVPMSNQLPCVWFNNLLLLMQRRKMSIVDRCRDYNLIVAGNCTPTVLVAPDMTVRGKRSQDRAWTKNLIRWLPLYTLETLLEYPPDNDDGLIGRKYTLPMLRRMETKDVQQLVKKFRVSLTEKGNAHMNADDRRVARILLDVANRNHARITDISHGREMYPPAPPMDDDPPAPAGAPPLVFRHTRPRRAAAPVDPGVARAGSAAVFPLPDGYDTATRFAVDCRAAANGVTDDDVGHIAAAKLPPGPFSSTPAEIHAFVLAVSQVAAGTALHVYSDSQAAIEAAHTQLSLTATVRQRVRCASRDLWSALRHALRDRNVKVTFSWVRGHADDPTTPNNAANCAAKAAANQLSATDAYFSKRTRAGSDLHHVPDFFDHEIGGDPRKFMRDLAQAECRDAVLAENVVYLELAQPPPPAPEPGPANAAAAAAVFATRVAAIPAWAIARRDAKEVGQPIPGEDALLPPLDLPAAAAARLSACAITRGAVHACREFLGSPAAAAAATVLHPLPSPRRLAAQLYDAAASLLRSRMWVLFVKSQADARVQTPHRNARYRRRRTKRVHPLAPARQRPRVETRDHPQGQARADVGLVGDTFALAAAGFTSTVDALQLFRHFANEREYIALNAVAEELAHVKTVWALQGDAINDQLAALSRTIFAPTADRVGWDFPEGESQLDALLRQLVVSVARLNGDKEVVAQAKARFARFVQGDATAVHPNLRGAVYAIVLKNAAVGSRTEFDALMAELLEYSLKGGKFVQDNWAQLEAQFKGSLSLLAHCVGIAADWADAEFADREVQGFFASKDTNHVVDRAIQQTLEKIRAQATWLNRDRDRDAVAAWLAANVQN
ncbi:hypothetical protein H9P43_004659 [Blastocladiella emersonii ATCC 22665]|nr:hypothetical protein H9P43_004659 [Blastocladiella emersonii ATCC 22665]